MHATNHNHRERYYATEKISPITPTCHKTLLQSPTAPLSITLRSVWLSGGWGQRICPSCLKRVGYEGSVDMWFCVVDNIAFDESRLSWDGEPKRIYGIHSSSTREVSYITDMNILYVCSVIERYTEYLALLPTDGRRAC